MEPHLQKFYRQAAVKPELLAIQRGMLVGHDVAQSSTMLVQLSSMCRLAKAEMERHESLQESFKSLQESYDELQEMYLELDEKHKKQQPFACLSKKDYERLLDRGCQLNSEIFGIDGMVEDIYWHLQSLEKQLGLRNDEADANHDAKADGKADDGVVEASGRAEQGAGGADTALKEAVNSHDCP